MDQLVEHIANEEEIKIFHSWITDLCNPDSKLVQDLQKHRFTQIASEVDPVLFPIKNDVPMLVTSTAQCDIDGKKLLRSLANKYVSLKIKITILY